MAVRICLDQIEQAIRRRIGEKRIPNEKICAGFDDVRRVWLAEKDDVWLGVARIDFEIDKVAINPLVVYTQATDLEIVAVDQAQKVIRIASRDADRERRRNSRLSVNCPCQQSQGPLILERSAPANGIIVAVVNDQAAVGVAVLLQIDRPRSPIIGKTRRVCACQPAPGSDLSLKPSHVLKVYRYPSASPTTRRTAR